MAKWGKADYKQLVQFRDRLEKLQKTDLDKFSQDMVRELASRLLAKVVKRTPVGKKPKFDGTARTVKVKGIKRSRVFLTAEGAKFAKIEKHWAGYVGGTLRRGWVAGLVKKVGNTYEVEIYNIVEYASFVEFGHRQTPGRFVPAIGKTLKKGWVTGKFMLTISEKELERDSERIIEARLMKLLEGAFDGK